MGGSRKHQRLLSSRRGGDRTNLHGLALNQGDFPNLLADGKKLPWNTWVFLPLRLRARINANPPKFLKWRLANCI